jgi:peptidoglycan hydrolase CwlO-like protein
VIELVLQKELTVVSKSFLKGFGCCLILTFCWANRSSALIDSSVFNNLSRSRQALLDQRQQLMDSAARLGQQIDALNRQLDTVNSYLRDTDKAIKDVEETMARMK